jgi:hypothetical protein
MKTILNFTLVVLTAMVLAGCLRDGRYTDAANLSQGEPVFSEVGDGSPAEKGKIDVVVRLSLKTPLEGYYLFESKKSRRGKTDYPLVINVDGQTVLWREDGKRETTPKYGPDGVRLPEGGDGMRYVFERRVRVSPGNHRIRVELPEERRSRTVELNLQERNEPYLLELKPIYSRSMKSRPCFVHGVSRLNPYLNGVRLENKDS